MKKEEEEEEEEKEEEEATMLIQPSPSTLMQSLAVPERRAIIRVPKQSAAQSHNANGKQSTRCKFDTALSDRSIAIVTDDHFVSTSGVLSVDQVINTGDLCYGVAATPGPSS